VERRGQAGLACPDDEGFEDVHARVNDGRGGSMPGALAAYTAVCKLDDIAPCPTDVGPTDMSLAERLDRLGGFSRSGA